jgi:hypothetical protein
LPVFHGEEGTSYEPDNSSLHVDDHANDQKENSILNTGQMIFGIWRRLSVTVKIQTFCPLDCKICSSYYKTIVRVSGCFSDVLLVVVIFDKYQQN